MLATPSALHFDVAACSSGAPLHVRCEWALARALQSQHSIPRFVTCARCAMLLAALERHSVRVADSLRFGDWPRNGNVLSSLRLASVTLCQGVARVCLRATFDVVDQSARATHSATGARDRAQD